MIMFNYFNPSQPIFLVVYMFLVSLSEHNFACLLTLLLNCVEQFVRQFYCWIHSSIY